MVATSTATPKRFEDPVFCMTLQDVFTFVLVGLVFLGGGYILYSVAKNLLFPPT